MLAVMFNPVKGFTQGKTLNPDEIVLAIENELLLDEGVSSHHIDVKIHEGIVTLSGRVDNLLASERAVQISESVKGVRSVINHLQIRPVLQSDKQIRTHVKKALLKDPVTEAYQIDVDVKDAIVTLDGEVESWTEKQLAAEVVKGVKGIVRLINHIRVVSDKKRTDDEIKQDIHGRLESSIWIDEDLIAVTVENSHVGLTGVVGSAAEKRRVCNAARVAGVQSVDSSGLEVRWWARDEFEKESKQPAASDNEIEQVIRDTFLWDPRIVSYYPDISAENGIVMLTGKVKSYRAKRAAEEDAKNTQGVIRVKNFLKVRPVIIPGDQEIEQDVEDTFRSDAVLGKSDLNVEVLNGKVYLNGRTKSEYEKNRAEKLASRQAGVVDVKNNLVVDRIWEPKSDRAIQEDIENEFFWSLHVNGKGIHVQVNEGDVRLTGTVDSRYEAEAAVEKAFQGGARTVDNDLRIEQGHDEELPDKYRHPPYPYSHYGPMDWR